MLAIFLGVTESTLEESRINFDDLIFEFYPCELEDDVVILERPSIKEWYEDRLTLEFDGKEYVWRDKSELYRNNKNLGCYLLLCVKWENSYQTIADSATIQLHTPYRRNYEY